jgi:predicted dehydrogenase/threonine dehydrogenase-like Zn-dependent dehydrogenase
MFQIIQDLKQGKTVLEEVPAPMVRQGYVLIKTSHSLVSLGTEKMLVEFSKANLIDKARQQPDKVKMVLDKIKTDGLMPTLEAVFSKLNQPLPLGYCNVGEVIEVGRGVEDLRVGDRVASNGHHAEFVCIPKNLVAKIPDQVSGEEAAFTVIGAIGLQGIRLINPTFGETVVVIGLGLIGLITAELLKSNGCRVIGLDFDQRKVDIAKTKGIDSIKVTDGVDPVKYVLEKTSGIGTDAVIITASAKTNEVISQAARMSRKRGKIVLVGVVGLDISRAEFYEKELSFQVSCSYGPGRYDDDYETKGIDYPLPFVRWTEKRNFETILHAISSGQLDVKPLITEVFSLKDYEKIYDNISASGSIASILKYNTSVHYGTKIELKPKDYGSSDGSIGIIGAGNFTNAVILPSLRKLGAKLTYIASAGGLSSTILAKKFSIYNATSDYQTILKDPDVNIVLITTRHDLHSKMAMETLTANKHVFVEKPLALNEVELGLIIDAQNITGKSVTVGFNRRFSPHIQKIKSLTGGSQMNIIATMNAGFIAPNSWVHNMEKGGGRILGEACHYIDLLIYLTGSKIVAVCMNSLGTQPMENTDNASILLKFENGSSGVINYFANGSKSYSKERLEVHFQEKSLIMDNFRKTTGFGIKGFSSLSTKQDKGHNEQFKRLIRFVKNGGSPIIPLDEIINSTKASIASIRSLKENKWILIE